jgi:hypothetical protein
MAVVSVPSAHPRLFFKRRLQIADCRLELRPDDVADYRDVDPKIGTLQDFDEMMARLREQGIKVMVDIVPNHSSDEHVWFQEALKAGKGSVARERYIFRDGELLRHALIQSNSLTDPQETAQTARFLPPTGHRSSAVQHGIESQTVNGISTCSILLSQISTGAIRKFEQISSRLFDFGRIGVYPDSEST